MKIGGAILKISGYILILFVVSFPIWKAMKQTIEQSRWIPIDGIVTAFELCSVKELTHNTPVSPGSINESQKIKTQYEYVVNNVKYYGSQTIDVDNYVANKIVNFRSETSDDCQVPITVFYNPNNPKDSFLYKRGYELGFAECFMMMAIVVVVIMRIHNILAKVFSSGTGEDVKIINATYLWERTRDLMNTYINKVVVENVNDVASLSSLEERTCLLYADVFGSVAAIFIAGVAKSPNSRHCANNFIHKLSDIAKQIKPNYPDAYNRLAIYLNIVAKNINLDFKIIKILVEKEINRRIALKSGKLASAIIEVAWRCALPNDLFDKDQLLEEAPQHVDCRDGYMEWFCCTCGKFFETEIARRKAGYFIECPFCGTKHNPNMSGSN